ncbi:MAG TPA: hypothetical protein VGR16_05475 [Thermomicrobiales bacterium]|nr:hypothetical protein [Thermomicrobiales bacterium]
MTRKTISVEEAQRDFAGMLRDVSTRGDSFVVELHGEPVAEVVPVGVSERSGQKRRELFALMDKAAANAGLSPEEADRVAEEAVTAVRAERARR